MKDSPVAQRRMLPPVVSTTFDLVRQHMAVAAFIGGFFFDVVTLGRIDSYANFAMHAFWLSLSAMVLVLSLLASSQWVFEGSPLRKLLGRLFVQHDQFVFHFATGALLSAFTIFYFKSSSGTNSMLFLAFLAGLLLLNEMERFQQFGAVVRCVIFQITALTFATYLLPTLLGHMGTGIFMLAVLASATLALFLGLLLRTKGYARSELMRNYTKPTCLAFALFVGLYASHAIPPIPLSTQHMSVVHGVSRTAVGYSVKSDPRGATWNPFSDSTFLARPGDRIYAFTQIFAPRQFADAIFLNWQRFESQAGWKTTDKIKMNIVGGRSLGYRGYGYKANYRPGKWRVLVETKNGREVGRMSFYVVEDISTGPREFETELL